MITLEVLLSFAFLCVIGCLFVAFAVLLGKKELLILSYVLLGAACIRTLLSPEQKKKLETVAVLGEGLKIFNRLEQYYLYQPPRSFFYYLFFPVTGIFSFFGARGRQEMKAYFILIQWILVLLIVQGFASYYRFYQHFTLETSLQWILLELLSVYFLCNFFAIPVATSSLKLSLAARRIRLFVVTFLALIVLTTFLIWFKFGGVKYDALIPISVAMDQRTGQLKIALGRLSSHQQKAQLDQHRPWRTWGMQGEKDNKPHFFPQMFDTTEMFLNHYCPKILDFNRERLFDTDEGRWVRPSQKLSERRHAVFSKQLNQAYQDLLARFSAFGEHEQIFLAITQTPKEAWGLVAMPFRESLFFLFRCTSDKPSLLLRLSDLSPQEAEDLRKAWDQSRFETSSEKLMARVIVEFAQKQMERAKSQMEKARKTLARVRKAVTPSFQKRRPPQTIAAPTSPAVPLRPTVIARKSRRSDDTGDSSLPSQSASSPKPSAIASSERADKPSSPTPSLENQVSLPPPTDEAIPLRDQRRRGQRSRAVARAERSEAPEEAKNGEALGRSSLEKDEKQKKGEPPSRIAAETSGAENSKNKALSPPEDAPSQDPSLAPSNKDPRPSTPFEPKRPSSTGLPPSPPRTGSPQPAPPGAQMPLEGTSIALPPPPSLTPPQKTELPTSAEPSPFEKSLKEQDIAGPSGRGRGIGFQGGLNGQTGSKQPLIVGKKAGLTAGRPTAGGDIRSRPPRRQSEPSKKRRIPRRFPGSMYVFKDRPLAVEEAKTGMNYLQRKIRAHLAYLQDQYRYNTQQIENIARPLIRLGLLAPETPLEARLRDLRTILQTTLRYDKTEEFLRPLDLWSEKLADLRNDLPSFEASLPSDLSKLAPLQAIVPLPIPKAVLNTPLAKKSGKSYQEALHLYAKHLMYWQKIASLSVPPLPSTHFTETAHLISSAVASVEVQRRRFVIHDKALLQFDYKRAFQAKLLLDHFGKSPPIIHTWWSLAYAQLLEWIMILFQLTMPIHILLIILAQIFLKAPWDAPSAEASPSKRKEDTPGKAPTPLPVGHA